MSHTEMNYNELVNPTFTTGQATLEMLAGSGNPDAIAYKELLSVAGATQKVSGNPKDQNQLFTPEEGRALMMGVTLGIEARYAAVSRLMKESGARSVLDVASGYTPRALMCRKAGVDYVGMDIPAVVEKMAPLTEKLLAGGAHPAYVAGDATNPASLKKAADMLEGELFITSEGLMTYLNESELEQTIAGVREILLERGGAWYTSDMDVQYDHFSAVAINNPDVLERWGKIMKSIKKETDVYFFPVSFKTMEEKIAFFEARGLRVERVPFYTEDTQLNMLHGFDAAGQARMKGLMKSFCMWKMTAAQDGARVSSQANGGLNVRHTLSGNVLTVALEGRLDTLSAPALMKLLDENEAAFGEMVFDLAGLEYLSSTGMRVLLMMAKRLGKEHVIVKNANALVSAILTGTGLCGAVTVA